MDITTSFDMEQGNRLRRKFKKHIIGKETNVSKYLLMPFHKTSRQYIVMLTGIFAIIVCILVEIIVVLTWPDWIGTPTPFYKTCISTFLDSNPAVSVPGMSLVAILVCIMGFARHPVFWSPSKAVAKKQKNQETPSEMQMKIFSISNLIGLILCTLASIGLLGVAVFTNNLSGPNALYPNYPGRMINEHASFTHMCFICFSLYEMYFTICSAINIGSNAIKRGVMTWIWLIIAAVFNACTICFYILWTNTQVNIFEWLSVTFIWLYFLCIGGGNVCGVIRFTSGEMTKENGVEMDYEDVWKTSRRLNGLL